MRQIVRLRAAIDEEDRSSPSGASAASRSENSADGGIVEARIGVQPQPLLADRLRKARMAMAEDRDIVDHVEIGAALDIEQVLLPAALDLRRRLVVILLRLCEMRLASGEQLVRLRLGRIGAWPEQARQAKGKAPTKRLPAMARQRAAARARAPCRAGHASHRAKMPRRRLSRWSVRAPPQRRPRRRGPDRRDAD